MKRHIVLMTSDNHFMCSLLAATPDLEPILELFPEKDLDAAIIDESHLVQTLSQSIPVLVISDKGDDSSIFTALQAGARGYVLKSRLTRSCAAGHTRRR